MFLFCLVFAMFCARLFISALWSPAGKGLTSWLSFVVSTVSLSLSHWYPGSGVVLDCINSWSLHPYLPYKLHKLDTMWAFGTEKCLCSTSPKKGTNFHDICTKQKVHIFNMRTTITHNINIKEWKLLELQITQTRHPKSVANGRTDGVDPLLHLLFTKVTQVKLWHCLYSSTSLGQSHVPKRNSSEKSYIFSCWF